MPAYIVLYSLIHKHHRYYKYLISLLVFVQMPVLNHTRMNCFVSCSNWAESRTRYLLLPIPNAYHFLLKQHKFLPCSFSLNAYLSELLINSFIIKPNGITVSTSRFK